MTANEDVDRHLREVFDGLVSAIYVTKQLVWSVTGSPRAELKVLLAFMIEQSHVVDEAEARVDGRAVTMAAPSSHDRRNLLGEVGNDVQTAVEVYAERVGGLANDIRRRASDLGDAKEAKLLVDVAEGLQRRLVDLVGAM